MTKINPYGLGMRPGCKPRSLMELKMDMEFNELRKKMKEMIDGAPCDWGILSRNFTQGDFNMLGKWVHNRLEILNRLAMYAGARGGNGCGDVGHDEALDATRF